MKPRAFLLILSLFLLSLPLRAQTNYYQTTKDFHEDGYVYRCETYGGSGYLQLYNLNNKYIHVSQKYLATGKNVPMYDMTEEFEKENWTKPKCYSIVNNAFTKEQTESCRGHTLGIELYINSETGKVMEVSFDFVNFGPFAYIPVSVFRKIETQLIEGVWFVPTEGGRKLNYISLYWNQELGTQIHK
ncbi:protein of unknown function [Prevotella sp. KH2C16]|nr:protein of unknown function [Prevotella sp. KH2C16]